MLGNPIPEYTQYTDADAEKLYLPLIVDNLNDQGLGALLEGTIIDLGCGTGKVLSEIRKKHPRARLIGVDLAPRQDHEGIEYVTASVTATGLPPEIADLVFILGLAGSSPGASVIHVVQEIDRLLKPGGVAAILSISEKWEYQTLFQVFAYTSLATCDFIHQKPRPV
ncbi:methyltransferase domain-containing protein [Candidatus Woesearchaeota archaeon]|nr:methyltransferase domain-containing protein [Candidatus Woesearchaeota archaeon]